MQIKSVALEIKQSKPTHPLPMIISIEGFGGSGKTTLASQLGDALRDAHIIHLDDFIVKFNSLEL